MTALAHIIPDLTLAIAHWRPDPAHELLAALATPAACCWISADCWPATVATSRAKAVTAAALAEVINHPAPDAAVLVVGLAALLGRAGIAKQRAAARKIRARGQVPMLVFLVAGAWSIETVALDAIQVH